MRVRERDICSGDDGLGVNLRVGRKDRALWACGRFWAEILSVERSWVGKVLVVKVVARETRSFGALSAVRRAASGSMPGRIEKGLSVGQRADLMH